MTTLATPGKQAGSSTVSQALLHQAPAPSASASAVAAPAARLPPVHSAQSQDCKLHRRAATCKRPHLVHHPAQQLWRHPHARPGACADPDQPARLAAPHGQAGVPLPAAVQALACKQTAYGEHTATLAAYPVEKPGAPEQQSAEGSREVRGPWPSSWRHRACARRRCRVLGRLSAAVGLLVTGAFSSQSSSRP